VSSVVLDASAVLALLAGESGAEKLTLDLLNDAVCSTVNLAEVQGKLVSHGIEAEVAWQAATRAVRAWMPFTDEHAKIAGSLITRTKSAGLSWGDRACLALAISLSAPVYTADRSWKDLKIGVRVHSLR
jgi:PIN domain nuclease of toxin-antitoxin system